MDFLKYENQNCKFFKIWRPNISILKYEDQNYKFSRRTKCLYFKTKIMH